MSGRFGYRVVVERIENGETAYTAEQWCKDLYFFGLRNDPQSRTRANIMDGLCYMASKAARELWRKMTHDWREQEKAERDSHEPA